VKVTLLNGIKAMICRLFTLPQMSARLKPTSIDNAKHIVTAVLKAEPIVLDPSSSAIVSFAGAWGGIRLSSSEPSGIESSFSSFTGVSTVPFSEPSDPCFPVVGLLAVVEFPSVVEFDTTDPCVAVLFYDPPILGPRFPLCLEEEPEEEEDFPDPPPPFDKSLEDSSSVAV